MASSGKNLDFLCEGMRLRLDSTYDAEELPEWRAAIFSIVLPFPAQGLPPALTANRFIDLGPSWLPGRFRGVQTMSSPIEIDGRFVAPDYARDGTASYSPRSFHQAAGARFKGPLAQSVGSTAVDEGLPPKRESSREAGSVVHEEESVGNAEEVRCHRFLFDADTYKAFNHDVREDGQPEHATAKYRILQDDAPSGVESPSVSLVCAEFLQYRGMLTHRFHESTGLSEAGELAHDFLVLHVVAENCEGHTLERISQSLHRPRNRVSIENWDEYTEDTSGRVSLLSFFSDLAVSAINADLPQSSSEQSDQDVFSAIIEGGGRLSGAYDEDTVKNPTTRLRNSAEPIRVWRRLGGSKPLRTVCAVPGHNDVSFPEIFGSPVEDETWDWHALDMWAWELGSGADTYAEGIPRYTSGSGTTPDRSRYEYWTMLPTPNGTAIVRNAYAAAEDSGPWMLSSTRFVDLAILVHRSTSMLSNVSERLRAIKFSTASTNRGATGRFAPNDEAQSLTSDLNTFQLIQSDFVRFRDRLWFDAVPDREFETDFMTALREATGAGQRYTDVKDELELREAVYTTQFNSRQIELDREMRNQAEEEAQQRSKSDSTQNLALGFLAIAFAVPGLVQLLPSNGSVWPFWLTVAFIIVFVVASLAFMRSRQKKGS